MEGPFTFDRPVSGKYFLGHKVECAVLGNLLSGGENVVIFGPPKTGKMSIVQQTMLNMQISGKTMTAVTVDAFNCRTVNSFLLKFGDSLMTAFGKSADEFSQLVKTMLPDSHFVFDQTQFELTGAVVSTNWDLDQHDMDLMMSLPSRLVGEKNIHLITIIRDFQTLGQLDGYLDLFKAIKKALSEKNGKSPFILMGSQANAMRAIFRDSAFFRNLVNILPLKPIEDSTIVDHIRAGFNITGKVIDRDVAMGPGKLFENNMWYINHIMTICDSLTRGFINDNVLRQALGQLISMHKVRFHSIIESLTGHQKNFLLAMIEEETRFSSSDVIRKYGLNSSANVIRVKEALMKKEIISLSDKDELFIIDPLFKYWLRTYYFGKAE